jgi:hypothetical protein
LVYHHKIDIITIISGNKPNISISAVGDSLSNHVVLLSFAFTLEFGTCARVILQSAL